MLHTSSAQATSSGIPASSHLIDLIRTTDAPATSYNASSGTISATAPVTLAVAPTMTQPYQPINVIAI